jgi:aminoglycoside phosphotransferase (APT) family kinase protein
MDDRLSIDTTTVRALLTVQFPEWARLALKRVEPGGWDNYTFRLGDSMSVRLPSAERYAAQPVKEAAVLPLLAGCLPVDIPEIVAAGRPGHGFPFPWTIRRWIEGVPLCDADDPDRVLLATDLADALRALRATEASGGPEAGEHSFYRGGPLDFYTGVVETCLADLKDRIDTDAAMRLWQAALARGWERPPVWVHGDVAPGNLLMRGGRLAALIDFGTVSVGDPACDLVMAWTVFDGEAREAFREAVGLDADTWARARGWALWKALLIESGRATAAPGQHPPLTVIETVLAEQQAA